MDKEQNKNKSIVDEFNRHKKFSLKLKFKIIDREYLWDIFLKTFSKTFHINKEIYEGFKFNLKIKNINNLYEIIKLDEKKKYLELKWTNQDDEYWLKFQLRKQYIGNKSIIKITESILRKKPFFGLQDTAGLIWLKSNFKKEMKNFKKSMNIVIQNNGAIPDDLTAFYESKFIKIIKKSSFVSFDELKKEMQKFYGINSLESQSTFVSKRNKYSLKYYVENVDQANNLIKLSWSQDKDKYSLEIMLRKSKLYFVQEISSIWTNSNRYKLRLIKKNLKELVNDFLKN